MNLCHLSFLFLNLNQSAYASGFNRDISIEFIKNHIDSAICARKNGSVWQLRVQDMLLVKDILFFTHRSRQPEDLLS